MTDEQKEAFYPMQKAINCLEARLEGLEGTREQNVAKDSLVKKVAGTLHAFTNRNPSVPVDERLPDRSPHHGNAMDIKEAKVAKVDLEKAIAALLAQFAESTGARVTNLSVDSIGMAPHYIVEAEVQL
jgi:Ser/Thr protein kinase RdoA (MazF antagonist)